MKKIHFKFKAKNKKEISAKALKKIKYNDLYLIRYYSQTKIVKYIETSKSSLKHSRVGFKIFIDLNGEFEYHLIKEDIIKKISPTSHPEYYL